MSTETKLDIFNKARVSNIMASVITATMLHGFIAGIPDTIVEDGMIGVIAGFAAKYRFLLRPGIDC